MERDGEEAEGEAGANAVMVLIYRVAWLGGRDEKEKGIMPFSGVVTQFIICMNNRDRARSSSRARILMQAGREEGIRRWRDGRGRGKYVHARVCGLDGSLQVRTLLDKPIDDMLSKTNQGLLLSWEGL